MKAFLSLLVAVAVAAPAAAQENEPRARSLQPIYVRTADREVEGQLLRIGSDTLTLLDKGTEREFGLVNVTRIDVRGDSVKNGAVIGAIVLGAWCAIVCAQGLDGYGRDYASVLLVNIGLGALVGAGIDSLHVGRTTIYRRPDAMTGSRPSRISLSVGLKF